MDECNDVRSMVRASAFLIGKIKNQIKLSEKHAYDPNISEYLDIAFRRYNLSQKDLLLVTHMLDFNLEHGEDLKEIEEIKELIGLSIMRYQKDLREDNDFRREMSQKKKALPK